MALSVCALNTLTYGLSYIMRCIFLVIFFSNNCTRLRLVQLLEKKMTRKIYVIMHSRSYVNAYLTLDSQGNLCLFCTISVKTKLTNSFVPVVPVNCPLPYHGGSSRGGRGALERRKKRNWNAGATSRIGWSAGALKKIRLER